jgi:hypothetical protein
MFRRCKREWLDPAGLLERRKTGPQVGLKASSSLVSAFRGYFEQAHVFDDCGWSRNTSGNR